MKLQLLPDNGRKEAESGEKPFSLYTPINNKVTSETINNQTFYNQDGERRKLDENLHNPSSIQSLIPEVGLHPHTKKPVALFEKKKHAIRKTIWYWITAEEVEQLQ